MHRSHRSSTWRQLVRRHPAWCHLPTSCHLRPIALKRDPAWCHLPAFLRPIALNRGWLKRKLRLLWLIGIPGPVLQAKLKLSG